MTKKLGGWTSWEGKGTAGQGRAGQGRMGYDIDTIGNMFMRENRESSEELQFTGRSHLRRQTLATVGVPV